MAPDVDYLMFYDHLSAHSLLAELGWLMRMRLASKRLHRNETRSTRSAGKGLVSQLCHYQELQTWERAGSSLPARGWDPFPGTQPTTWLLVAWRPQSNNSFCLRIIYNGPPSRPHHVTFYDMRGEGRLLLPRSWMALEKLVWTSRYCYTPFIPQWPWTYFLMFTRSVYMVQNMFFFFLTNPPNPTPPPH